MLATIAVPALLPALGGVIPRRRGISKRSHIRAVGRDLVLAASQVGLTLTMLAYQAWLMTDAIVRTLVRVYVTRRLAGMGDRGAGEGRAPPRSRAASTGGWPAASRSPSPRRSRSRGRGQQAWPAALPFAPVVGRVARGGALDQPAPDAPRPTEPLSPADARALRLIARRTWRFFATFVGSGGPRAAARQLPGDAEPGGRASHLAHQHRAVSAVHGGRARFRLARHARHRRASGGDARDDATPRALSRPLLQLVRHAATASRSSRSTSRRSTAAISPAISSRSRMPVEEMASARVSAPRGAGRDRATRCSSSRLALAAATAAARDPPPGGERLEEALAAVTASLRRASLDRSRVARTARRPAGPRRRPCWTARARWSSAEPGPRPRRCSSGRRRSRATRRKPHARPRPAPTRCGRRLASRAGRARALVDAMDFSFLFDPMRKLFAIGYRVADGSARPEPLRSARVGGAAGQLRRDRQGRRARLALVPPRPRADAGGAAARRWCPGRARCSST